MSLSSRKSIGCYNRGTQKKVASDAIDEVFSIERDPIEYEDWGGCKCEYCNPSPKWIAHNRLIWALLRLQAISPTLYENALYY